jgi:hypothetical protein
MVTMTLSTPAFASCGGYDSTATPVVRTDGHLTLSVLVVPIPFQKSTPVVVPVIPDFPLVDLVARPGGPVA